MLDSLEKIEFLVNSFRENIPADIAAKRFDCNEIDSNVSAEIINAAQRLSIEERMRLYSYTAQAANGEIRKMFEDKSFLCLSEIVKEGMVDNDFNQTKKDIKKDKAQISLPLRVNWCGTWTDTPPYCLENGGAVVNAAVKINNRLPVNASIKIIDEPKVILEYFDSGYRGEFFKINELADCSNPLDPFLLLKSALIASGLIPMPGEETKDNIFKTLGGGICLSAGVKGIPKGSGLGTSSILLTACIKAVFRLFGQQVSDDEVIRRVLFAEQLMGTGGGWQDQAGGLTNGVKYCSSLEGQRQYVVCDHLRLPQQFSDELNERFCLVYSGQRRLGRTILKEIMGGYIRSDPAFTGALGKFHSLAGTMKNNIELGCFNGFIDNLNSQTDLTLTLGTGYTNELINNILCVCNDMTAGRMICGAGGGGFLQLILKDGYTRENLSTLLRSSFPGQGIDVWKCDFV
jgi:fucokinase